MRRALSESHVRVHKSGQEATFALRSEAEKPRRGEAQDEPSESWAPLISPRNQKGFGDFSFSSFLGTNTNSFQHFWPAGTFPEVKKGYSHQEILGIAELLNMV